MRFDYDKIDPIIGYKLINSTVTPRPIAWVTTISNDGLVNAAPYSFFNVLGREPAVIGLGVLSCPKKGFKDTARNIMANGEFVVNLVPEALAEDMNATCIDAPADVSEIELNGIETTPSDFIKPPRIARSPVAFECVNLSSIVTGPNQLTVIGKVLAMHIEDQYILDAEKGYVDTPALDMIGRLHGSGWYTRTKDVFQLVRPSWDDQPK